MLRFFYNFPKLLFSGILSSHIYNTRSSTELTLHLKGADFNSSVLTKKLIFYSLKRRILKLVKKIVHTVNIFLKTYIDFYFLCAIQYK